MKRATLIYPWTETRMYKPLKPDKLLKPTLAVSILIKHRQIYNVEVTVVIILS